MKTKLTYILIFILTLTYSCHKYDENTLLFKKPEKCFFGNKTIINYYVDGINKTDMINQKVNYIWFSSNNEDTYLYDIVIYLKPDTNVNGVGPQGIWKLIDNKKNLYMYMQRQTALLSTSDSVIDFFLFSKTKWNIIKLKKFDAKLETDYNNHHYQLELN